MGILGTTCPHCFKQNIAFQSIAEFAHTTNSDNFTVFFKCPNCEKGLVGTIRRTHAVSPLKYPADIESSDKFVIYDIYPAPPALEAPQHTPDNISNFFLQAAIALQSESWDASAMMSRKIVEVTAKQLDPDFSGNLYQRIDNLANENHITPSLKNWAHEVRLEGNEAAHEIEVFDEKTAKDLHSFTELFLMYIYTLPGMLEERRQSED